MSMIVALSALSYAAPPAAETWNLTDLYATPVAFQAALVEARGHLGAVDACRGHLGESAARLVTCLTARDDVWYGRFGRLGAYADNLAAENMENAEAVGWSAEVSLLRTTFAERASFMDPELIALGEPRLTALIAEDAKLLPWRKELVDLIRDSKHRLTAEGESLLAASGSVRDAPYMAFELLSTAELPFPTVTLPDGTVETIRPSSYQRLRESPDRAARKVVYDAYYKTWADFRGTLGATLYGTVLGHVFNAKARHFETSREAALAGDHLDPALYDALVAGAEAHLPTLHRYLALRARMMGISDLAYHDLYPALVSSELKFPIAKGKSLVLTAVAPLGTDYVSTMKKAFDARWMDTYPGEAKRGGAYMDDQGKGFHPYVLMNYNDDWDGVSTLGHEWGHALHSVLSHRGQPQPTADYATFLAEVASTFNEALLQDYALAHAKTDDEKLFYLGHALENLRTTFFRQAMFAAFESKIHAEVEKGGALTGEDFDVIYLDLLRRWHGHDTGVCTIDESMASEWSFIPHFYYDFYVWQYATSIAASAQLADSVTHGSKKDREAARVRYLALLSAGGSADPYELLKTAGVDMAGPGPYDALAKRMELIMDQIEAILAKQKPAAN